MEVGVMSERLPPGMEDGDHAGLGAEVLWIATNDADGLSCALKKNVVHKSLILECNRSNGGRYGKDEMEIGHWKQFGIAVCYPLSAGECLAFWAVSIAAAVVSNSERAAVLATIDVAAESSGATTLDGGNDVPLGGGEPISLQRAKGRTVAAKNVCDLNGGPHDLKVALLRGNDCERESVERTRRVGN
jgi:hypothetical protein